MHVKMTNNLPLVHVIKDKPWDPIIMPILGNRNRDLIQNGFHQMVSLDFSIHNKEVSTVLKEMSTVLVLLYIKSTQIELKYGIYKT